VRGLTRRQGEWGRLRTRYAELVRPHALAVLAISVVAFSGCSGTSTRSTPQDKALVSEAQIDRGDPASPQGITLRMWRAVQIGDIPSAVVLYHQSVRRAIGVQNIAGTLAQLRAPVALLQPKVLSVATTELGKEVTLRAMSGGSSVGIQSFLLLRDQGEWRIAYDTLFGDALPTFVQGDVQNRLGSNSSAAVRKAQVAGARMAVRYRTLFLVQPLTPKSQPGGRGPSAPPR
jgi:uncharacterized protein YceK